MRLGFIGSYHGYVGKGVPPGTDTELIVAVTDTGTVAVVPPPVVVFCVIAMLIRSIELRHRLSYRVGVAPGSARNRFICSGVRTNRSP